MRAPLAPPRLSVPRKVAADAQAMERPEFRATVGTDFNLMLGLGVHAAYDFGTGTNTQNGWGVGAHFNFRVPVPM